MINCMKYFLTLVVLAACSLRAVAVEPLQHDTIYFYETWAHMLDVEPSAMIVDPLIDVITPYEIDISTGNDGINEHIKSDFIALSLGDSIWFMNSGYLKRNFKGDVRHLNGFVPVFFNEKQAYLTYHADLSAKEIIFGISVGEDGEYLYNVDFFYLDFLNRKVIKVNRDNLSAMLEDYHDLQMRYDGIKDSKNRDIIEYFFLKFIDRATDDYMRPYLLDLAD